MEEKVLIKSKKKSLKVIKTALGILAGVLFIIPILDYLFAHSKNWGFGWYIAQGSALPLICWLLAGVTVALLVVFSKMYSKADLTVTDKRAYGLAAFNKRVDIPIDMISAVGTGAFSTVKIASSSGAIKFGMLENCGEIHSVISKLLMDRQNNKKQEAPTTIIEKSEANELEKYKELLDKGIITREEFEAKKKQILGL